jgi:hypothetical protein
MGGKALSRPSVRLPKAAYDKLAARCAATLQAAYPQGRVAAVQSYAAKADHGDLDVLVTAPGYDPFQAAKALDAVEVVRNGPVTSVGVLVPTPAKADGEAAESCLFQVDLIAIDAPSFDYASRYFAFNDLGNLIGRTAHRMGLAHRHDGLWYYVREGDYKFREIVLTRNYAEALWFLGYDAQRFNEGFETLQDIFEYVAGSSFFSRDIFLLENRNARARVRDRKRPTYMAFLQYCEAHPELPGFDYPESKSAWLPRIVKHFAHFQREYDQALADLEERRTVKVKFNGEWVSQLTGLQGKELGELMRRFKESFESPQAQRDFVLRSSDSELEARVQQLTSDSSD